MTEDAPSASVKRIDITDPNQLFAADVIPSGVDAASLPTVYEDLNKKLPHRTVLALVQLELVESNWESVTARDILERDGNRFKQNTYSQRLQSLADAGILTKRSVGTTYEYRLPDDCKPAADFTDDTVEFITPDMMYSRVGVIRALSAVLPNWFDNQYVSLGELIFIVVILNLVWLLGTGTFGPISESAPRVIVAWALLSFAISALGVGGGIALYNKFRTG